LNAASVAAEAWKRGALVHPLASGHRQLSAFFCDQQRFSYRTPFDASNLLAVSSLCVRKMTRQYCRLQELSRP